MTEAPAYPTRCYWTYQEDGTAHFIPECWGGINGPDQCTCKAPRSQIEALEAENARLRQTVQSFRNARGQSDRIRVWYQDRIAKLQARLDEYEPRPKIEIDPE